MGNKLFLNLFKNKDGKAYAAGETIIAAGDKGESMYVVLEGVVEIRLGERRVESGGPGCIFGEMALIDEDSPRSATVLALTACRLLEIDRKRFEYLVSETPFFALEIMKVMSRRLRKANVAVAG